MPNNGSSKPPLLSVAAVARRLSVCDRTIRRAIRSGALLSFKVGGQIRISEEQLQHYLMSKS